MKTTLKTFAKLNLSLLVHPINSEGMHPIYSVFQTISLHDEIIIETSNKSTINCSNPNVPTNSQNCLFQIYEAFKDKIKQPFCLTLKKNIPMGGGLGGGSSNAAAFLNFLNQKEKWNYSTNELIDISKPFGSDIAFFLVGGTALVSEIGNKVQKLENTNQCYLLIFPAIHCNTKEIYQAFDKLKTTPLITKKEETFILNNYTGPNYLEAVVFEKYPIYQKIQNYIPNKTLKLSGSGAACFFELTNDVEGINIQNKLKLLAPELKTTIVHSVTYAFQKS